MAWGILDRFLRPKWLLDRILLVSEHVAASDDGALPAVLIDTLREQLGAQYACIHFAAHGMACRETQDAFRAACPAALTGADNPAQSGAAEARFWQMALASGHVVAASAMPTALQDELRPVLEAAGIRDGLAIPLLYRGDVYAVVNLYFKRAVPSNLAIAEDVLRSIRLLGNLVYGTLMQQYHQGLLQEENAVTLAIAEAAATRDGYAAGHVARVCALAVALGKAAGMSRLELEAARKSAMLRDIGKLHVPDYVLQRSGPLSAEERRLAREHPVLGARMLLEAGSGIALAGESRALVVSTVRSHHERLDGSGYPDGLSGSSVPVLARLVAIADVYAALTADRPYRPAFSVPRAVETLEELAGPKLDPDLVSLFLTREIHTATGPGSSREPEPAEVSTAP